MANMILTPPVAIIVVFIAVIAFSWLMSRLAYRRKDKPAGLGESYACGEEVSSSLMQPEYGQFFPFAFFFTILHVVTLMITTLPVETIQSFTIAIIYIAGAVVGLMILFRR